MMVDPAIGVRPGISGAYDRGSAAGIWMKEPNGTDYLGSKYFPLVIGTRPDVFQLYGLESRYGLIGSTRSVQAFWNSEFQIFFNPKDGIDIDGVWIDMNEPANFCRYPCLDPIRKQQPKVFHRRGTVPAFLTFLYVNLKEEEQLNGLSKMVKWTY
jgi:alpha-glucosidase